MTGLLTLVATLVLQQPATVGDTVWVGMTVRVPSRMIVRPQTWDLGEVGQTLGPPELVFTGDSVRLRYPLALWYAGDHVLRVPGPIVVSPEGKSDTLPAVSTRVLVYSVLPPDSSREQLAPRPAAEPVPQASASLLPVVVLEAIGLVALGLFYWSAMRRARRRREQVPEPVPPALDVPATLRRWEGAGERRAALDGWAHVIERRAAETGSVVSPETAAWLAAAERAAFQPEAEAAELDRLLAAVPALDEPDGEAPT